MACWLTGLSLAIGCSSGGAGAQGRDAAAEHDSADQGQAGVGDAGAGGAAGQGGAGGCAQDLTGTWDLIAQRSDGPMTGVLVISADTLSLQLGGDSLVYTARPTKQATWQGGPTRPSRAITVANTPAAFASGSIPLALGGAWTFTVGGTQCSASVAPGVVSAVCQGPTANVGGDDWPQAIPNPIAGRTYTATRGSALASQFGDLGGAWQTMASSGNGGACTATVTGNAVTTMCAGIVPFNGTMHVAIGSDCVASGSTQTISGGSEFELSGQRR